MLLAHRAVNWNVKSEYQADQSYNEVSLSLYLVTKKFHSLSISPV